MSQSAGSGPQFFVDIKKGEINELRGLLLKYPLEKDINKQRETIKKVIAYMTLGIDVSRFFADMVKAARTSDLIIKKMVYLYIVNYTEHNQECAILGINTFLTDCKSLDFKIRALALRTLSSLKFSAALTYIEKAVTDGLTDADPHVRKTAIMGAAKLYRQSPVMVKEGRYIETLYSLIKDRDAQVAINAVIALNEILEDEGGIAITRKLMVYLLNRLKEFHDWGQTLIIGLLSRYEPKTNDELLNILNILEDRLSHASNSVLLASTKVFMNYTRSSPVLNRQVMKRLQAPLITLMTSGETTGNYEITYVILQHIYLIAVRYSLSNPDYNLFQDDYKHFFCKMEEPSYIKDTKIDILAYIANESNTKEIISELSEYVVDVNTDLAKKAIACIAHIGVFVPTAIETVMHNLVKFFKHSTEYISSECIIGCAVLLRKFPEFIDQVIPSIENIHSLIAKTEAKVALIWILGEFGEKMASAPYVLEHYASSSPNESGALDIFYSLLTATSKLFFKRPGECKPVLGSLLKQLMTNCDNNDLRAKAVMYYNLFSAGVQQAKEIIVGDKQPAILRFLEDEDNERKDRIYKEFNTFSVIYREPQEKFLKKELVQRAYQQEQESEAKVATAVDHLEPEDKSEEAETPPVQPAAQPAGNVSKSLLVPRLNRRTGTPSRPTSFPFPTSSLRRLL